MLSNQKALEQCLTIYNDFRVPEQRRLSRVDQALKPQVDENGLPRPRLELPDDAPELMAQLALEGETNYLALLLDTYSQVMIVDGYTSESDPDGVDPWKVWQRNRMDSRQIPLHRSALAYSAAYAVALPGRTRDGLGYPAVSVHSPKTLTALFSDDEVDDWPVWALAKVGSHFHMYDENTVYIFGLEHDRPGLVGGLTAPVAGRFLTFIESRPHDVGVTPVVRYRDRQYMEDDTVLGIIEPLLTVQRRIDRTSANQMMAQQLAIFKQKYSIGWTPKDDEEKFKASVAKMVYVDQDPSEVHLGEWDATPITPYLEAGNQARRDFAAIGQVPAQSMGIDGISNISDATLAGLEAAKNRRADVITTSLGESHEQLLRLFASLTGNQAAANDYSSEALWRDFEARSFAQTVDGLVKLVGIGYPQEVAMGDIPGMSPQKLRRIKEEMRKARGRETLLATRRAPATTTPPGEAASPSGPPVQWVAPPPVSPGV